MTTLSEQPYCSISIILRAALNFAAILQNPDINWDIHCAWYITAQIEQLSNKKDN